MKHFSMQMNFDTEKDLRLDRDFSLQFCKNAFFSF